MALSTGQMVGIGAVVAGVVGFLFWRKSKATPAAPKTPAAPVKTAPAAAAVPRTLAPSNPYPPDSWKGAGYDLGYADAARDRTLGTPQNLTPEPPDAAYKAATDPFDLEAGYIEGYNFYWKAVTV